MGLFEIVDRLGVVAKFFGGLMLFFASLPLYWLGRAMVEYFRFGTLKVVLYALPGMVVTLFGLHYSVCFARTEQIWEL